MAKPKLALIPSSQGSKLYSVLPSSGVGDFDFSRSGGATRINSQGLIETVASGVSRLNYPMIDGKVVGCPSHLLEPQRLQRIQYSEDFSNAYWTKVRTNIISGFISPKGDTSAYKFIEDANSSTHFIYSNTFTTITGNDYTTSVYAKAGERNWIYLRGLSGESAYFDLINGVIGTITSATATIEEMSDGWYKCSLTGETTDVTSRAYIFIATGNEVNDYIGDGTSGVYIFGAMVEQGSFPTSYIPNYGTALGVTRSAETATNSGDASTFNDSEGVLMIEARIKDDGFNKFITLSDGSDDDRITIYFYTAINDDIRFQVRSNNINQPLTPNPIGYNIDEFNKIAINYKQNDVRAYVNGFLVVSNNGNLDTPLNLSELAFDDGGGAGNLYGSAKQIQYFDTALSDTDLEKLTSWVSFSDMANGQLYTIE